MRLAQSPGGVLQQAHGPDVVLGDVILSAPLAGILEVDGRSVHKQCHHTGKVFHKVPVAHLQSGGRKACYGMHKRFNAIVLLCRPAFVSKRPEMGGRTSKAVPGGFCRFCDSGPKP